MAVVKEKFLATFLAVLGHATNRIADTSTERACQSKWCYKRMETKRIFLTRF